jgi:hypothetical protein
MKTHQYILAGVALLLASCSGESESETKPVKGDDKDTTAVKDTTDITGDAMEIDTVVNEDNQVIIDDSKGSASADKVDSKTYDLTQYGYAMSIDLPEGTKISKTELDEVELQFGQDFVLMIGESFEDSPQTRKNGFKNTVHNQVLGYILDEADGFIVKMKSNGIETHNIFYMFTLGDMKVQVENAQGKGYSKAEIMAMHKAIKTIKIKG